VKISAIKDKVRVSFKIFVLWHRALKPIENNSADLWETIAGACGQLLDRKALCDPEFKPLALASLFGKILFPNERRLACLTVKALFVVWTVTIMLNLTVTAFGTRRETVFYSFYSSLHELVYVTNNRKKFIS
jgi:hypothetical protein